MKKFCIVLLVVAVTLQSCSLISQTTIGPQKAFELGDGQHGSFKATVKNVSGVPVEICEAALGSIETCLLTLLPGQQTTVRFAANTKAIFKNSNNKKADLTLKVTGDTGLTMGGPNY